MVTEIENYAKHLKIPEGLKLYEFWDMDNDLTDLRFENEDGLVQLFISVHPRPNKFSILKVREALQGIK